MGEKFCVRIDRVLDYTVETHRQMGMEINVGYHSETDYAGVGLDMFYCNVFHYM